MPAPEQLPEYSSIPPKRSLRRSIPLWMGERAAMQGIIGLIIEIIAGVIGGNAAGAAAKKASLGTAGNSIAGAIGGLVLGQILGALGIGEPGMATAEGAAPAEAFQLPPERADVHLDEVVVVTLEPPDQGEQLRL